MGQRPNNEYDEDKDKQREKNSGGGIGFHKLAIGQLIGTHTILIRYFLKTIRG